MVDSGLITTAEKTLKKLAQPKVEESKLVQQVAIMDKLISSGLREVGMQSVVDKYIDQVFHSKDFESYQTLCAVVRLFDGKPELPHEVKFIRLLSARLCEKNKARINAVSGGVIPFMPSESSEAFAHEL